MCARKSGCLLVYPAHSELYQNHPVALSFCFFHIKQLSEILTGYTVSSVLSTGGVGKKSAILTIGKDTK